MKILHINTADLGGGAEDFALSITEAEVNSLLLVGFKHTKKNFVTKIPQNFITVFLSCLNLIYQKLYFTVELKSFLWKLGFKLKAPDLRSQFGIQNRFHQTYRTLKKMREYKDADIIHLHNIHGSFFDIKAVLKIAKEKKVVWTSHDTWILTGGEGAIIENMPDELRRKCHPLRGGIIDNRKSQQKIKRALFRQCKEIRIVAPSKEHRNKILAFYPENKVETIYCGVDLNIFSPKKVKNVKNYIPKLLIYNTSSIFKNSKEIISSLISVERTFELHVIGTHFEHEKFTKIINHGHVKCRLKMAELLRAIDIACFASNAETFGLFPAEAAACGALVYLNQTLPVFKEHNDLYGAILYRNEEHLKQLVELALDNLDTTRKQGMISAELIREKFNRKVAFTKYKRVYNELTRR